MESSEETPRVRGLAIAAAIVAALELALAVWAAWIALTVGGACPASGGAFSCEAIFRPKLASLMGIPIAKVALLGAVASVTAAALLMKRNPSGGFARATAFGAMAGAAFAIGVQPLSWIGAGAACPVCLGLAACSVIYGALATVIAIRLKKDAWLAIVFGISLAVLILPFSSRRGMEIRASDELALEHVERISVPEPLPAMRPPFELMLLERSGCPYCKAVKIDVLADARFEEACRGNGVFVERVRVDAPTTPPEARREPVPTLVLLRNGRELGRVEGYYPSLEPYLDLLAKTRAK